MSAKAPADLLDQAADLIEQRGHAVGKYEDDHGRLCALGAINMAASGRSIITVLTEAACTRPAKTLLHDEVVEGSAFDGVMEWNDESDASTVVATMRAAAAKAVQS